MNPEDTKRKIEELEKKVAKLESILLGFANDTRLQAQIRNSVIKGEHTAGKPTIIASNGKRYNLQTV
jgi:hypothetical protein